MSSHYLRTEHRSTLQAVELAWDQVLRLDGSDTDRLVVRTLQSIVGRDGTPWLFVGRRDLANYFAAMGDGAIIDAVTIDARGDLSSRDVASLVRATSARLDGTTAVLIGLTDRYDAHRVSSALPAGTTVVTLDALKEALGDRLPASAWRESFDHVYPVTIPEIEFRDGLDVLLLDLPARSIAQLPLGFAYVYKAVRQAGVNVQAVDIDVIAYHRYHARRCMNHLPHIEFKGVTHPQDPWQPEHYLLWTDRNSVECFSDILDEVVAKVIAANPKCLGFSLHQTSHVAIDYVVERVRLALPDICVIVGGMSCYQHIVASRVFPAADYVVVGEADTVVGPLTAAIARGERPRDVPGAVSKHDTPGREFIAAPLPHNLDVVGAPDYSFTDLSLYVNWNRYKLMPLVGTRGCGWSRCTFCAERFNWRARTPELVAEEIEYYTTQGFKSFVFNESDFNSNKSFVMRLCQEIIRRGIKGTFTAQLRIGKDCDYEYYKTMHEAGFRCLRFGVDGLAENTLRLQRKGYTKQMVLDNLKHCHDLGIYTEINVVIGVPGETDADVDESAEFMIEMKPYIGRVAFINPLMLFVGSVYYFEPEAHNIKFVGSKDDLYARYHVALPDDSWYSEEPFIDHNVRRERFLRLVERIHDAGLPLGAFADFTAKRRRGAEATPAAATAADAPNAAPGAAPAAPAAPRVVSIDSRFYLATDETLEAQRVLRTYPSPSLLKSYKGYNLVGLGRQILAAPICLGRMDLTGSAVADDARILKTATTDEACRIIDAIEAAAEMTRQMEAVAREAAAARPRPTQTARPDVLAAVTPTVQRRKLNLGAGVLLRPGR